MDEPVVWRGFIFNRTAPRLYLTLSERSADHQACVPYGVRARADAVRLPVRVAASVVSGVHRQRLRPLAHRRASGSASYAGDPKSDVHGWSVYISVGHSGWCV